MVLPLIAGIGSKILSSGKTDDKNIDASKKKIKTEKFFDKKDKSAALVKTNATKIKIKPSSALVKYQPPEKNKDKISDLSSADKKKSTGDELQSIIDEVKKLRSGLVRVRGLLAERKNSDLKSLVESRKVLQIEKKKRREDELERKKPEENKGGISLPKPKFSFFDSIINFFTSILIGSLLNFLLANKNTIFNAFNSISKGFNNIFNVMRYAIISISTTMPKLIKSLASFGAKVFKGSAKLTGNLLKKLGGTIKNLLVRTGKALGSFVSGTFKNLRGLAGGAGASATRATGVQQRRLTGAGGAKPGARPKLRQLPKPGVPKPTSPATLTNAERLFTKGGFKHFKKVSGIFKKVPFIGALIGIGIDLAMGERLDNAIAGAAGASLGAAIGGAIGTAVLPIPFVGTFLGGTVGAAVGDWAGKEIYKKLSGQVTQINPPPEPSTNQGGYNPSLAAALNQPLPGPSGTGTGAASGPGAEGLAGFVAKAETGGRFNAYNGDWRTGRKGDNNILSLKLNELRSYMDKNHPNSSGAVGAYQFMPETAIGLSKQLGMDPSKTIFTPEVQKQLHLRHLKSLGYDDFVSGKMNRQKFGMNIAQQYRALPDPRTGYTWSDNASSRNRATVPLQSYLNALDRSKQQGSTTIAPPQAPVLPGPDGKMPTQASPTTPLIGAGNATFGSTGRVSNAPNWVHGHFQDNNKNALLNNTFLVVKRLLEQGVSVVITGGPGEEQLNRNMSDSRIRSAISKGIDRHSNRTRGYFAVDVSVPKGTKVPVPLQDVRSGGNEGISGLIPGTNTFIGHLAPGSKSVTAAELAQSLRQQASYDQRGGTIVVPAPVISGGGGQTMPSGGGGGILPVGMLQKDVLNSYYRAQLLGFLYKQG
jgi:hypothetical protein